MAGPGNQTPLLSTLSLPEMTDLIRRSWVLMQTLVQPVARQLFIVENIGAGQGSTKIWNEADTEIYADFKAEGANSKKAKVGVGYNVTMVARTFSKEIDITLEMRNDNRYTEVGTYMTNLSKFCQQRQDLDLTHRFTFANATSYVDKNGETIDLTVGDGKAVLDAAHTLAFSATTYTNIVPGNPVFSQAAFEAAMYITTTNIYSNFGEKRVMDFNTIITGDDPNTVREVQQFIRSTSDVTQNNPGVINYYLGTKRHVILPMLATTAAGATDSTKKKWWFVGAIGNKLNGWQAYLGEWISPTLRTPSPGNNGEDIHTFNWTYAAYCRYGIAVVSPKGLVGSCPVT